MKALKISAYEKGKVRVEPYEILKPGKGEVRIKTLYSTISPGTELAWIYHMENTPGQYPFDPGYSCCGRVEEVGSEVDVLKPGDVVVCNQFHCSEFITPANKCIKVRKDVGEAEASAFRLASISLQGVRKAEIQIADRVAVLGLGPIGNLAAQLAYVAGAGEVIGFDFVDWKRKIAEKCNIPLTAVSGEEEIYQDAFEVVIEATGAPQAVNTALRMVKPRGKVILLGSSRGCTDNVNFYRDVHRKGISIIGAHEMHRSKTNKEDEETIVSLLEQGRICTKPLISTIASPEDAQDIYEQLLGKEREIMLAVFKWNEE